MIDFKIAGLQEAMDEAFTALADARSAPKETAEAAREFTADCKAATKQIKDSHDDFKFQLTKLGNSPPKSAAPPPPPKPPKQPESQPSPPGDGALPPSGANSTVPNPGTAGVANGTFVNGEPQKG